MQDDLNLWRNIVREYSEELLGEPEHDGSSGQPLDYECWPFYRAMQRAREAGHLRAYVLGVVLHALGLNPAITTAVVIDDVVFDDLFRELVTVNAEGQVVTSLFGGRIAVDESATSTSRVKLGSARADTANPLISAHSVCRESRSDAIRRSAASTRLTIAVTGPGFPATAVPAAGPLHVAPATLGCGPSLY